MGGPSVGQDVYLAMIDPSSTQLVWSTFVGGTNDDWGYAANMNAQGHLAVALGTLYAQCVWAESTSPLGLSASDALQSF